MELAEMERPRLRPTLGGTETETKKNNHSTKIQVKIKPKPISKSNDAHK
jgi:hypothetical protein